MQPDMAHNNTLMALTCPYQDLKELYSSTTTISVSILQNKAQKKTIEREKRREREKRKKN